MCFSKEFLTLVLCALFPVVCFAGSQQSVGPVAVACFVSGQVSMGSSETAPSQPVAVFARFSPGMVLQTQPDGHLTVAFLSGKRFEVEPDSRVLVQETGLKSIRGGFKTLPSVPSSVSLKPILLEPGTKSAASVRLRAGEDDEVVTGMYPRDGASIMLSQADFRFNPVSDANKYRITIEDDSGNTLFDSIIKETTAHVSSPQLKPGNSYHWRVEASGASGAFAWGGASFYTLSDEQSGMRENLRKYAESETDPSSWTLLANLDLSLGLLQEAEEDLRQALSLSGGNRDLEEALANVIKRLEQE